MLRNHQGVLSRALVVESPDPVLDKLLEAQGIKVDRRKEVPDEKLLVRWLQEGQHQLLFKRSRVVVSREVLEQSPSLMAIQLCCIGDDSIDKQACADHGVLVFNDPVSNARSVVELAIAHLTALSRRLYETNDHTKKGGFDKASTERYEILGRPLGILGLGNIGRQVARAAEALGMKILFYDSREVAREVGREMGWQECPSVEALFRASEYISVHVSAQDISGKSNKGMLKLEHFKTLGADRPADAPRIFLNLARGFLHTTEDLLQAVEQGSIQRAAVDVYPEEPCGKEPWENPYKNQPRIVTTPHLGAATQDAQPRIARRVAQTITSFNRYGTLRDCVFRPRLNLSLNELSPESVVLAVVHAPVRGSRKAIQDAIYEAGASNLASIHQDFEELSMAYDLCAIDRPLTESQLKRIQEIAKELTGEAGAVRSIRQIPLQFST
jgi:D-3-phosphoglycerate dehydrogenase